MSDEEKYQQLQSNYYKLEEEHRKLQRKVRRGKIFRRFLSICVIVGLTWHFWDSIKAWEIWSILDEEETTQEDIAYDSEGKPLGKIVAVKKGLVTDPLEMTGKIEPLDVATVLSPMEANIQEKRFQSGDFVEKGEVIIILDTNKEEAEYRKAQIAYMDALEKSKELHNWNNELEVIRARRTVTEAKLSLESEKRELQETQSLFDKGIVSASEFEAAQDKLRTVKIGHQIAKEDLQTTLEKGSKSNREKADLTLKNARLKMEEIEARLPLSKIISPASGVILFQDSEGEDSTKIEVGVLVKLDRILFVVENMAGLKIKSLIEEMDILKLEMNQAVKIKGDAFPEITLEGIITDISSRAEGSNDSYSSSSVAKFPVTVTVSKVEKSQMEFLRLGMSAEMEIVVYENENALLVPFEAIDVEMEAEEEKRFVQLFDKKTKTAKRVEVETGATTVDSVEVLKGITETDLLLIEIEEEI